MTARRLPGWVPLAALAASLVLAWLNFLMTGALLSRLPPATWGQIPFSDDWTELYQQAVNGVHLLQSGSVVGWNWWLMGGYPTSTDIAQNLSTLAIAPMALAGEQAGYHLLHAAMFLALPAFVWWDISREDREAGVVAGGFACLFVAGYFATLGNSEDTSSPAGVLSASLALMGSGAASAGADRCRFSASRSACTHTRRSSCTP